MDSHDPFDDLLNLEEQYYKEGYEEGFRDGAEAGRIEGYSLGLSKGFEKFIEAGRLQSRAVVWANRIPKYQKRRQDSTAEQNDRIGELPPIQSNARLEKNIEMLYGLVEPGTFSMTNDDEAVNDFDSRMKGAQSKLKLIERAIGEKSTQTTTGLVSPAGKNENIEEFQGIQRPAEEKPKESEGEGEGFQI